MGGDSEESSRTIEVESTSGPGLDALEKEYANAKARIEHQHEVLKEFSREGMKMFRIMILFIAIPATILGAFSIDALLNFTEVLLSSETAVLFYNNDGFSHSQIFVSSGVCAVLSIIFHISASGQEFKGIRNQTNPNDMGLLIEHNITEESYLKMKIELLCERIKENRKTLRILEDFLAAGKIFTFLTVSGAGILFYKIVTGQPISVIVLLVIAAFLVWIMNKLPSNYIRADRFFGEEEPFDDEFEVKVE